jgi:hypothetical protein
MWNSYDVRVTLSTREPPTEDPIKRDPELKAQTAFSSGRASL